MPQSIRDWIDRYLNYASTLAYYQAFNSMQNHRTLWTALPDLVWNCSGLRYGCPRPSPAPPAPRDANLRPSP